MKKLMLLLVLVGVAVLCPSCFSTRTSIGDYRIATKADNANAYTYAKAKQCYLFWGLIPLGHASVAVPRDGHCEVRTSFGFVDFLVSALTAGIFSMQTIKVKAPKYNMAHSRPVPPPPAHAPAPSHPAPPRH